MNKSEIFFNLQYRATEFASESSKQKLKSVNTGEMFDYYDRDEACDKTICNTEEAFDYYNYRIGSTGAFNEKGMVERSEYFNKMNKYKPQVVYRGVFSFRDEFAIEQDIKEPEKMRDLIKKTMNKNIIAMGFEPDNVEWFAFYHTNTGHPHIHFHFYEKSPKKSKYLISKNRLAKVKSNVARLMKLNIDLYKDRDKLKQRIFNKFDELGLSNDTREFVIRSENNSFKYFKVNNEILKKMKELEKVIPKKGSLKYNSANIAPYKDKINEIIDLIKNREDIKEIMDQYEVQLDKEVESQIILYGGKKDDKYKIEFKENRWNIIDTRLGNMILSTIKNYRLDVEDYEEAIEKMEESENVRKHRTQKLKSISHKNMKHRASRLVAGIGREICSSIERSYYSEVKTKNMIEKVRERALIEAHATKQI